LWAGPFRAAKQQVDEPRQVWIVAGNEQISRLAAQPIALSLRRIVRLQITRG